MEGFSSRTSHLDGSHASKTCGSVSVQLPSISIFLSLLIVRLALPLSRPQHRVSIRKTRRASLLESQLASGGSKFEAQRSGSNSGLRHMQLTKRLIIPPERLWVCCQGCKLRWCTLRRPEGETPRSGWRSAGEVAHHPSASSGWKTFAWSSLHTTYNVLNRMGP